MLDFDNNHAWGPELAAALGELVPDTVVAKLVANSPQYMEDARDLLLSCVDKTHIIDVTLSWIKSNSIAAYHGCRLDQFELEAVRTLGLLPLDAQARRPRLQRALSVHPRWDSVSHRLDRALQDFGSRDMAGSRRGQVHLTLSRCGLLEGFNHYLIYGSEFDQQVAQHLIGVDGKELLRKDGSATIIKVEVPGVTALSAVNRYFSVDDFLARGEIPGLVNQFLSAWSYGLAYPSFHSATQQIDCGLVFYSTVPPEWIVALDILPV